MATVTYQPASPSVLSCTVVSRRPLARRRDVDLQQRQLPHQRGKTGEFYLEKFFGATNNLRKFFYNFLNFLQKF